MLSQTQATLCVISTHVGTQLVLSCSQQVSHLALFLYPILLKEKAITELGFCKFKASVLLAGNISSSLSMRTDWNRCEIETQLSHIVSQYWRSSENDSQSCLIHNSLTWCDIWYQDANRTIVENVAKHNLFISFQNQDFCFCFSKE